MLELLSELKCKYFHSTIIGSIKYKKYMCGGADSAPPVRYRVNRGSFGNMSKKNILHQRHLVMIENCTKSPQITEPNILRGGEEN